MRMNLKPLFLGEVDAVQFHCELNPKDYDILTSDSFSSLIKVDGSVSNIEGIVTLTANVSFSYTALCDRCAKETSRDFRFTVKEQLINELNDTENDDFILLEDMILELDDLIISSVLLTFPTKYVCSDKCKGICQSCGHNLNHSGCGCRSAEADPRWDALKNLMK